jgi:hypothetical protein
MTHRDPVPPLPADEDVARMHELAKRDYDAVSKERILAAVGIRINRLEIEELSEEAVPEPEQAVHTEETAAALRIS